MINVIGIFTTNRLRKAWAGLRESQAGILPTTTRANGNLLLLLLLWQSVWAAFSKTYHLHFIVKIHSIHHRLLQIEPSGNFSSLHMLELMKLLRTVLFALTLGNFLQNYKKMLHHLKYAYCLRKYTSTVDIKIKTILGIDLQGPCYFFHFSVINYKELLPINYK